MIRESSQVAISGRRNSRIRLQISARSADWSIKDQDRVHVQWMDGAGPGRQRSPRKSNEVGMEETTDYVGAMADAGPHPQENKSARVHS